MSIPTSLIEMQMNRDEHTQDHNNKLKEVIILLQKYSRHYILLANAWTRTHRPERLEDKKTKKKKKRKSPTNKNMSIKARPCSSKRHLHLQWYQRRSPRSSLKLSSSSFRWSSGQQQRDSESERGHRGRELADGVQVRTYTTSIARVLRWRISKLYFIILYLPPSNPVLSYFAY